MEIELKLALSAAHLHKISSQRLLREFTTAGPVEHQLTSHYFDTPNAQLQKLGLSLRVREQQQQATQTLKSTPDGAVSAGALARGEWETPVRSGAPDLRALRKSAGMPRKYARALRRIDRAGSLVEQFVVRADRTTWMLRVGGATIEMALDEGTVVSDSKKNSFSEVELELKSGKRAALYAAARQLAQHVPLQLSFVSKSARGGALRGKGLQPQKALPITFPARASVEQGMQRILAACLTHAQANAQGFLDSDNPEYLHQLRVGMRRFRSALKLFRDIVTLPADLQQQLDDVSGLLGAARDADVLLLTTLPYIADGTRQREFLQPLFDYATTFVEAKRVAARSAVHTTRHAQFMLGLFEWVDGKRWRKDITTRGRARLAAPLARYVRRAVSKAHALVARRARKVRKLGGRDSASLHRLRIGCKQARYAVEFFADIERRGQAGRYIRTLSAVQDALGMLNDVHVAQTILPTFISARPDLSVAINVVNAHLSGVAEAQLGKSHAPWRELTRSKAQLGVKRLVRSGGH